MWKEKKKLWMSNRNLNYPFSTEIFCRLFDQMRFIIDEEAKGATAKSKTTEEEQEEEATTSYKQLAAPIEISMDAATPGGVFSLKDTE